MQQRTKILNKDLLYELTNSPYWKKRKTLKKTKTLSQYLIHFYSKDFTITVEIDGSGVLFFVNDEHDFPIKSKQITNILSRLKLESELQGWTKSCVRNYNEIRANIFNNILDGE